MKNLIFDIETGPLQDSELLRICPQFDPAAVAVGNLKDPEKIAAKIMAASENHFADFKAGAALDALTCEVLAIGYQFDGNEPKVILHDTTGEVGLLETFWGMYRDLTSHYRVAPRMVGFNIEKFDLPVLFRRSMRHGLATPDLFNGRYWSQSVVDLRRVWQMGDYQAKGSLDAICRAFGIGAKTGDGAMFAETLKADPAKAIAYLKNDVTMTAALYGRMFPAY